MLMLHVRAIRLMSGTAGRFRGLWGGESGATAIEYGLIAGLIALVIVGVVTTMGTKLNTSFQSLNSNLR